jgi:exonuclease VII small subunit
MKLTREQVQTYVKNHPDEFHSIVEILMRKNEKLEEALNAWDKALELTQEILHPESDYDD